MTALCWIGPYSTWYTICDSIAQDVGRNNAIINHFDLEMICFMHFFDKFGSGSNHTALYGTAQCATAQQYLFILVLPIAELARIAELA